MHPLLARGERLALYLALWIIVGALLAALLVGHGGLTLGGALAVAFPISIAYAFVCVSAWYVARSTPLATSGIVRLSATAVGAALMSSMAWLVAARGWNTALSRLWGITAPFREIAPIVFGFGVLLYLLSVAV